jgi:hypothetical protein
MKHTEVRSRFEGKEAEYQEYTVLLVDVDRVEGDDIDVVISELREMERVPEAKQIRLYSAAVREGEGGLPVSSFDVFMGGLPLPGVLEEDFTLMVQLPIAPEEVPGRETLSPLAGIHIGPECQEIWLLVRPIAEYPPEVLPD